jgi:predicted glycosyltransferase
MKIAVYYNHYGTLGHSTRIAALLKGIKTRFPSSRIVLFEGGKTSSLLQLSGYAQAYHLPFSPGEKGLWVEENRPLYDRLVASGKFEVMRQRRESLICSVLKDFKPDIFMTEFFPFGREFWTFEIRRILQFVKSSLSCQVVGSTGYLCCTDNTYEDVRAYYDRLFVHSPEIFALKHVRYALGGQAQGLARVLRDFKSKICYTGFVLDGVQKDEGRTLRVTLTRQKFKRLIFSSRGGGMVNSSLIRATLLSARGNRGDYYVICTGPATSSQDMADFKRSARGLENVGLFKTMAPEIFDRYLSAADICVGMSGYNTSVRLLYYRKRAVLVPFHTSEQRARAALLKEYLPVKVMAEDHLTGSRLSQAINDVFRVPFPAPQLPISSFDGVKETISLLQSTQVSQRS